MLVVNYREDWENDFAEIKSILLEYVGNLKIEVEHIGSTSVQGLASKPIIDIDIVYQDREDFNKIAEKLKTAGYYHNGDQGILGREVFKRLPPHKTHEVLDTIAHHLYMCHESNEELKKHIFFRETLRKDEDLRVRYQKLKLELAQKANQNKKAYAQLKEKEGQEFFKSVFDLTT